MKPRIAVASRFLLVLALLFTAGFARAQQGALTLTHADGPLVFLAAPGQVQMTLLTTPGQGPAPGSSFDIRVYSTADSTLVPTTLHSSQPAGTVWTGNLPAQPGVPLIFLTRVRSPYIGAPFGAEIITGWVEGNKFACCDNTQLAVTAKVSFSPDNSAIISFGGLNTNTPTPWTGYPLSVRVTNVRSFFGGGGKC
jgi:hypothetical protein